MTSGRAPNTVSEAKYSPSRPKPVDDLIGDEQNVVFRARLLGPAVVVRRRHDHSPDGQDRLGDHAGDSLGPDALDLGTQPVDLGVAEFPERHALSS